MIYVPLFLICVVLFELFALLKMGGDALAIIARSRDSMRVLASTELSDDEKEAYVRRGSLDIFKATMRFALKFAFIALILYLVFLAIVTLFPALRDGMVKAFYSPLVIVILTVGTMAYAWARKKMRAHPQTEGGKT